MPAPVEHTAAPRRKRKPLAACIAGNAKGAPPPGPLPQFVKFADLREAGICATYPALRLLVEQHGFPVGRWFGANTRVWTVDEVMTWLAARPSERPVPLTKQPVAAEKRR